MMSGQPFVHAYPQHLRKKSKNDNTLESTITLNTPYTHSWIFKVYCIRGWHWTTVGRHVLKKCPLQKKRTPELSVSNHLYQTASTVLLIHTCSCIHIHMHTQMYPFTHTHTALHVRVWHTFHFEALVSKHPFEAAVNLELPLMFGHPLHVGSNKKQLHPCITNDCYMHTTAAVAGIL